MKTSNLEKKGKDLLALLVNGSQEFRRKQWSFSGQKLLSLQLIRRR